MLAIGGPAAHPAVAQPAEGDSPPDFVLDGTRVEPGTKAEITVHLSSGRDSTVLPISVLHGRRPGPVLGVTAGVHGVEYVPIMAAQKLARDIDPDSLRGTVVLVQLANVPAFLNRTVELNPQDGKNLNRAFPGDADGTITERIAHFLSTEVIGQSDYFLDMHAGDANNDLRSYVGYYEYSSQQAVSDEGRAMARALGFPVIVEFGSTTDFEGPSTYCSREAYAQGIPAVDTEVGNKGLVEEDKVERLRGGVRNLLKHLEMTDGPAELVEDPLFVDERRTVSSAHDGFFYSDLESGDYVAEGMKLGYVTDYFGNHLQDVHAPADSFILYMRFGPAVRASESLFSLAVTDE